MDQVQISGLPCALFLGGIIPSTGLARIILSDPVSLTGGHPAVAVADAEAAAELAKEEHELGRTPAREGRKEGRQGGLEGDGRRCDEKGKQCDTIYDTNQRRPHSCVQARFRHESHDISPVFQQRFGREDYQSRVH